MTAEVRKRIAIYSRKSKFTGKGESIENQIELCRQYIRAHDAGGVGAAEECLIYEDEGFSGGTLKRPQFSRMMGDARSGKISAVIVYRLDRISRSIGDFAKLIEELNALGIAFISIREQFDTSSPMGRAMMYIASVFSQLERETIAERIRDNLHELAKTGRWLGGTTPTGYESESVSGVTVDGKVKKSCRLKVIPEEADMIRRIYGVFLKTGSLKETERYLAQNGYRSKNKKPLSRFAVRGILSNPVYMEADQEAYDYLTGAGADVSGAEAAFDGSHGVMVYNRTLQRQGKTHQLLPENEWIAALGAHEGLVSGRDWVRAQRLLEENCMTKNSRRGTENGALLAGLLFCGDCGSLMRVRLAGTDGRTGARKFSYLCTKKEKSKSGDCRMKNADGRALDAAVLEAIGGLPEDTAVFCRYLEAGKKRFLKELSQTEERVRLRRSGELDREIEGLVLALGRAAGTPSEPYIREQIAILHGKAEALKAGPAGGEKRKEGEALPEEEAERICRMCRSFHILLRELRPEARRRISRELLLRVVWDGDRVEAYPRAGEERVKNR